MSMPIGRARLAPGVRTYIEVRWMENAACRDISVLTFIPDDGKALRAYNEARKVCAVCPVRDACLEYALEGDEQFGIWGGLTPHERRKVIRARGETCRLPGCENPRPVGAPGNPSYCSPKCSAAGERERDRASDRRRRAERGKAS